jgi:hypothetical protein
MTDLSSASAARGTFGRRIRGGFLKRSYGFRMPETRPSIVSRVWYGDAA